MTRKVFWEDPYLVRLETRVAAVDGARLRLAGTVFFAESGGQESDAGTIGGHPVLAACWAGRDIDYTLPADHGLAAGDAVAVAIDWPRRHRLMRLHFAAEIVLELAVRRLGPVPRLGAHIAAAKARIDFALADSIAGHLPPLEAAANRLVAEDRPIVSAYSDRAAERRYWEVAGFARVPCGGTHLRSTGEVGALRLKRNNIGRGKERIEVRLAEAPG